MPTSIPTKIIGNLADRMIELYCDWRTASAEVQRAYEDFSGAQLPDRAGAYAVYTAALDREQCACESYAAQVRAIESWCASAGAPART